MGNYYQKKGKGKLPIFGGNEEPVITVYAAQESTSGWAGDNKVSLESTSDGIEYDNTIPFKKTLAI